MCDCKKICSETRTQRFCKSFAVVNHLVRHRPNAILIHVGYLHWPGFEGLRCETGLIALNGQDLTRNDREGRR